MTALEALLDAEKLDLLMVGSPNNMHLDHIRIGLERGLKIFCRKAGRHDRSTRAWSSPA